jgi:hypothetical protein
MLLEWACEMWGVELTMDSMVEYTFYTVEKV